MSPAITSLEVQKKNKERVNIYVDGEFLFACDAELVYKYNLKSGMQIDTEKLVAIVEEDNYSRCKAQALRFLERSSKTMEQLKAKLLEKGYSEATIERAVEMLENYSLIDDSAYAKQFVSSKQRTAGRRKIKYELLNRGVDQELIEETLEKQLGENYMEALKALASKKLQSLSKNNEERAAMKKTIDFLLRKGYTYGEVKEVLGNILEED